MNTVPEWRLAGDWFDICSCNIPCPCEFAQPPTKNVCQGMLVWHVREGHFGDVRLDDLNLVALGGFEGNLWAGAKATMGLFIDEKANPQQRQALQFKAFKRASVPASSIPMRREYPATSADSIAASLL
jgi:hypothetical protein